MSPQQTDPSRGPRLRLVGTDAESAGRAAGVTVRAGDGGALKQVAPRRPEPILPTGESKQRGMTSSPGGLAAKLSDVGKGLTGPTDPRWVLAVRTAEMLEGAVLPPERREGLMRLGRVLGLTPFDATLIIAIVQDQARRGYEPSYCPTAGERQLEMVPLPGGARLTSVLPGHRALRIGIALAALLATELIVLHAIFG